MAKITFNKLGLEVDINKVKEIILENGAVVEVRQILPTFDKLKLINETIKNSILDGKVDPALMDYVFDFAIIDYFTNITFTDKQRETDATYDKILHSGLFDQIWDAIPEQERDNLVELTNQSIAATNNVLASSYNGLVAQSMSLEASKKFMGDLNPNKKEQ